MTSTDLMGLVAKVQGGDGAVREALLEDYRPFISATVAACCRRSLDWQNDDELSIGLIAFNEALDTYKSETGVPFLNYARLVIRHRLYDYFRKERKGEHLVLSLSEGDEELEPGAARQAWDHYRQEVLVRERAEELAAYQAELAKLGLSLQEVARVCPKHRSTRERLLRAAALLAENQELAAYFREQGRLPLGELAARTGLNRKSLERGRKYIVAVALVLLNEEYTYLREYLQVPQEKGGGGR